MARCKSSIVIPSVITDLTAIREKLAKHGITMHDNGGRVVSIAGRNRTDGIAFNTDSKHLVENAQEYSIGITDEQLRMILCVRAGKLQDDEPEIKREVSGENKSTVATAEAELV